jgi:hypothetical protein
MASWWQPAGTVHGSVCALVSVLALLTHQTRPLDVAGVLLHLQATAPLTSGDASALATGRGSSEVVLTPEDLVPLTRRRLLVVCDGDAAGELMRYVHCPACARSLVHPEPTSLLLCWLRA